jgi:hypothetical protein
MSNANISASELLDALERAGRYPDPALIEACLERPDELTPGLLDILRADVENRDPPWKEGDPRWYRMIHAGLLLIHFREEAALPLLVEDYRRSDADTFNEWFTNKLRLYGPPAVPSLTDLLLDEDADVWGRIEAAGELAHIAWAHPEVRDDAVQALRDVLPPVTDDGLPDGSDDVGDRPILWAEVAYGLGRLQDEASRSQIEALFAHDLMDTMLFGDVDVYRRLLQGKGDAWTGFEPASFDVMEHYERLHREGQHEAQRRAERKRQKKGAEHASEGGYHAHGTFTRDAPKVGRNDLCPCGSGRKYKHCCG